MRASCSAAARVGTRMKVSAASSGIEIARQLDEELTIAGKIGGAEQPDATRSDHLVAGGSMTVS